MEVQYLPAAADWRCLTFNQQPTGVKAVSRAVIKLFLRLLYNWLWILAVVCDEPGLSFWSDPSQLSHPFISGTWKILNDMDPVFFTNSNLNLSRNASKACELELQFCKICYVGHAHSPSWLCSVSNICNSCKVHASMKDSAKCECLFCATFSSSWWK